MFVLSSRFAELEAQKQKVIQDRDALLTKVSQLEIQNQSLQAQLDEATQHGPSGFDANLVDCTLDSLKQVEGIRETVLDSYHQIETESQSIAKINQLFDESSTALAVIIKEMKTLSSKMQGMNDNIGGLSDKADNINKFVSTITSISDQTNLLALNAAIEAARAGDAGRGFSVVADEVRSLANETNKSASEVADLVSSIISSTKGAVNSVNEIRDNNSHLTEGVDKLNQNYSSIVDCCNSMKSTITNSSHRAFIQTVKLDHIVWKGDVYSVIHGLSDKSVDSFADHASCRLGKWQSGPGRTAYGQKSAFQKLDAAHAKVHESGVKAITLFKQDQHQQAIAQLHNMEQASQKVMGYLDELVDGH